MKNIALIFIFSVLSAAAFAQDTTVVASNTPAGVKLRRLKTNDQVLPRWALDANYKFSSLKQDIEMIDLETSYTESIRSRNDFSSPVFSEGSSHGGSLQLAYFFGKSRQFGIGLGLSVFIQKGTISMEHFQTQYRSEKDADSNTFRQLLTSTKPVTEEVQMTNIAIPLTLKYKHQFENSSFGITIDAGAFLGVSNTIKYNGRSNFDYEAVYRYENGVAVYDNGDNFNSQSEIITADFWQAHQTSDGGLSNYFDRKRKEGMNVALAADANRHDETSYNKMSYGFIFQPALTYYLSYNTSFMLGGYYMYQVFGNTGNENYRLTDKVGEYQSINDGVKKNQVTSLGLSVGFRFFFGEKRDVDGDKVPDAVDDCIKIYGLTTFKGCPDYDGDGIKDDIDECAFVAGDESANGCPDRDHDGIADDKDGCPDEAGVRYPADPTLNGCPESKLFRELARKNNVEIPDKPVETETLETYFDVLQTDVIHFDFGKAVVLESNYVALDDAANLLAKNGKIIIFISGHTDSVGTYEKNMKLSFARANAVSQYLQNKGISKDRIIISGYGRENPLTTNDKAENRALNRRTEMKLLLPITGKK